MSGDRADHVAIERGRVVDDRHAAAAEHVRRPHDQRKPDLRGDLSCFVGTTRRRAARRLRNPQIPEQLREPLAVFRQVDRVRRRADDANPGRLQPQRQLERRLPAVLHDARDLAAGLLLARDDRRDVLERQRLEIQAVDGVVVGRNGLGIAVDHDRFVAFVAQRERGVTAAVVELEALPDAVRPAAEDDDLAPRRRIGLAFLFVGAVEVGRERLELCRAGVDALVGRDEPVLGSQAANRFVVCAEDGAESASLSPARFNVRSKSVDIPRSPTRPAERHSSTICENCVRNHGSIFVSSCSWLDRPAAIERAEDRPHPPIIRNAQLALQGASLLQPSPDRRSDGCQAGRSATRSSRAPASGTPS